MVLIPLLFPPLAGASPIYLGGSWTINDGGTYDASQFSGTAVAVQNGTLKILPGADLVYAIAAWNNTTNPYSDNTATITMSGGKVEQGISGQQGTITISGGQINGAASNEINALDVFSSAVISGGTFIGANSTTYPGSAIVGSAGDGHTAGSSVVIPIMSTLKISGGTFIGGTGSGGFYGGTTGYSLVSIGKTTVTGGKFDSPIAINGSYGGKTDFIGKSLTYQNGILSGFLQNGDPIHVQIYPDFTTATVNGTGTEVNFLPSGSAPPPTPIPEPTSVWIFGLLALLGLARRRVRFSHA
jgi:MYXO-CTERM domain-containing protein